jgi:hypothetical protein
MPITPEQIETIDALLRDAPADYDTVVALRKAVIGATATRCDASDMAEETPFRSYSLCNLYLLDGRDHCVRVTVDPSVATGFILAAKGESA